MSASPPLSSSTAQRSHSRSLTASTLDSSDWEDASAASSDANTATSVKARMQLWKASEQRQHHATAAASTTRAHPPLHNHSPSTPYIPHIDAQDDDKREHTDTSFSTSLHPADEPRADRKNVKDAFLLRLQQAQSEREEEERRRHDSTYRQELLTAKEGKHRAQESLQLKITVDAAGTTPLAPAHAPRPLHLIPNLAQTHAHSQPTSPHHRPVAITPTSFELDSHSFAASPLPPPTRPPRPPTLVAQLHSTVASPSSSPSSSPLSKPLSGILPPPLPDTRLRASSSPGPLPDGSSNPTSSPPPLPSSSSSSSSSSPSPPAAPQFPPGADDPAHRLLIVSEIISSEQSYVTSLSTLISLYLHPLKASSEPLLPSSELSLIFGGVELLHGFHVIFLQDLRAADGQVASVVLRLCDYLRMYTAYLQNYPSALSTLDAQRKNRAFQTFLTDARKRSPSSLDLMSYLIMPVQRVPRYELLLRELMRYTPDTHPERATLCAALTKVVSVAVHINASARHAGEMSKLMQIQQQLAQHGMGAGEFGTLLQPHRRLVKEGRVTKMKGEGGGGGGRLGVGGGGRRLILFNDLLIWATDSGRFRGHARLEGMGVEGWEDKKGRVGFVLKAHAGEAGGGGVDGGEQQRVFVCATQAECDDWVQAIGELCTEERRRSGTIKHSSSAGELRMRSVSTMGGRRGVRGGGRETHAKLMESLKELKARGGEGGSRVSKAGGEEEEKEPAEEEGDVSRIRRRGSFESVSMSVSAYANEGED